MFILDLSSATINTPSLYCRIRLNFNCQDYFGEGRFGYAMYSPFSVFQYRFLFDEIQLHFQSLILFQVKLFSDPAILCLVQFHQERNPHQMPTKKFMRFYWLTFKRQHLRGPNKKSHN